MKCLSYFTGLFKVPGPVGHEEIALHVRRLNVLLQAYQQIKTMTVAEWQTTEREIEIELQWFDIHHLKLTNASHPILPAHIYSANTSNSKNQPTRTARTDEQIEKTASLKFGFKQ